MRLLCVVDSTLKTVLEQGLRGAAFIWCKSWTEASQALARETIDFIIALGRLVENDTAALHMWAAASQIRYFATQAVFVDLSYHAANLIQSFYPQIKLISYQNNPSQFFLQLQTCWPEFITEVHSSSESINSASTNAKLYAKSQLGSNRSEQSHSAVAQLAPPNELQARFEPPSKQSRYTGSLAAVSSIPLGIHTSKSAPPTTRTATPNPFHVPHAKEDSSDIELSLADMSSISGLTPISSISGIDHILFAASGEDDIAPVQIQASPYQSSPAATASKSEFEGTLSPSELKASPPKKICLKRDASDVLIGSLNFGTLMRVIVTISRLELTGILTIKNKTHTVNIEFKNGSAFSNSNPSLIMGALSWAVGDYSFNPQSMLSHKAEPINLNVLITTTLKEVFSLSPILKALGSELQKYVLLTNWFKPRQHEAQWWEKCSGLTKLTDVMLVENVSVDIIARDIYLAWLCDEIVFINAPFHGKISIVYDKSRAQSSLPDKREKSNFGASNPPEDAHLNSIKVELARIKHSFESADGYTILGLKPGCGTKALDDAYYAWINRYHADRFVRYRDEAVIKLANDLLVMMNTIYPKISKMERLGSSAFRSSNSQLNTNTPAPSSLGNQRIGSGRNRPPTLQPTPPPSDQRHRTSSHEFNTAENLNSAINTSRTNRVHIRPASTTTGRTVPRSPASTTANENPPPLKMSDYLAKRTNSSPYLNTVNPYTETVSPTTQPNTADSAPPKYTPAGLPPISPEQAFKTGRKRLLLGLNQDALDAFAQAQSGDPTNPDYIIHHAYASFLVIPSHADNAITTIREQIESAQAAAKLNPSETQKQLLFSAYYFLGKILLAQENYPQAAEYLKRANKINPSDVDTQRSLRYATMQIEKLSQKATNKGLLARFKDSFGTKS